jgi:hypothetical protein
MANITTDKLVSIFHDEVKKRMANDEPGWETFDYCYDKNDVLEFIETNTKYRTPEMGSLTKEEFVRSMSDLVSVWEDRGAEGRQLREQARKDQSRIEPF